MPCYSHPANEWPDGTDFKAGATSRSHVGASAHPPQSWAGPATFYPLTRHAELSNGTGEQRRTGFSFSFSSPSPSPDSLGGLLSMANTHTSPNPHPRAHLPMAPIFPLGILIPTESNFLKEKLKKEKSFLTNQLTLLMTGGRGAVLKPQAGALQPSDLLPAHEE